MADAKKIITSFEFFEKHENMMGSRGCEFLRQVDWPLQEVAHLSTVKE